MLNPAVAVPLAVLFATPVAFVFRWFQYRERIAALAAGGGPPADDDRLARLERAVESIAVEVERIGEGQRYLTRVLADRPLPSVAPPGTRAPTNTPH